LRQIDSAAEQLDEVAAAAEDERAIVHLDGKRHAYPAADMLLEAGRAGKTFGRMDHLGKSDTARLEPRPDLTPPGPGPRHGDDARRSTLTAQRKRRADQARELRKAPAGATESCLGDAAHIDEGRAAREPFDEATANGRRQRRPVMLREERAEAQVEERGR